MLNGKCTKGFSSGSTYTSFFESVRNLQRVMVRRKDLQEFLRGLLNKETACVCYTDWNGQLVPCEKVVSFGSLQVKNILAVYILLDYFISLRHERNNEHRLSIRKAMVAHVVRTLVGDMTNKRWFRGQKRLGLLWQPIIRCILDGTLSTHLGK